MSRPQSCAAQARPTRQEMERFTEREHVGENPCARDEKEASLGSKFRAPRVRLCFSWPFLGAKHVLQSQNRTSAHGRILERYHTIDAV